MMFYSSTASCPNTPGGFYNGWGWHVQLLPYVEQQNVFADFDFNVGGSHLPGGREALGNVIDAYICPDDPLGKRWVECCSGYHNGPGPNDDVRATSMAGVADSRSFYCGSYRSGRTDANGVLYNLSATTIADVRDGTSNTLLVGEVTGGQGSHPSYGPATITYHWYNWAIQDVAQGINGPGSVPGGRSDTVDPLDGDGGNRHDELYDEVGFCSFHPGGAHFALCDGSVQFLSENINHSVLEALATRAGREPIPADAF
jgi:prepilin-type processing-associated H-X9-DG protein